ncbi:hypothetical protein B0H14DRAFT_3423257 [Mycena olivaceomarginata]|nr:hypothetical protein B0H14DRAFT_3423257 [Mycena olivaceomarginata]
MGTLRLIWAPTVGPTTPPQLMALHSHSKRGDHFVPPFTPYFRPPPHGLPFASGPPACSVALLACPSFLFHHYLEIHCHHPRARYLPHCVLDGSFARWRRSCVRFPPPCALVARHLRLRIDPQYLQHACPIATVCALNLSAHAPVTCRSHTRSPPHARSLLTLAALAPAWALDTYTMRTQWSPPILDSRTHAPSFLTALARAQALNTCTMGARWSPPILSARTLVVAHCSRTRSSCSFLAALALVSRHPCAILPLSACLLTVVHARSIPAACALNSPPGDPDDPLFTFTI